MKLTGRIILLLTAVLLAARPAWAQSLLLTNTAAGARDSTNQIHFTGHMRFGKDLLYREYEIRTNGPGQMWVDYQARRNEPLDVYRKPKVFYPNKPAPWSMVDPDTCFSIFNDRLLFVSITDGYLRPRRYQVVELSLSQGKYWRLVRNAQTVSCPCYAADGRTIKVTVSGKTQQIAAPFR